MRYVLVLLTLSCATQQPAYFPRLANVTSYRVNTPKLTPGGIRYGGELDAAELDRITAKVSQCLAALPEPSEAQKSAMECPPVALRRDVDPRAFNVYVPTDWGINCRGEQVFKCSIDQRHCLSKGIEEGSLKDCPCSCRAVVQDNRTIVTTPNLKVYTQELVRLVTACNYPYLGGNILGASCFR